MSDAGIEQWGRAWAAAIEGKANLRLFALLDPAQDKQSIPMLVSERAPNECLFNYDLDSPIAKATPRLVSLGASSSSPFLTWLTRTMPKRPVASLMMSSFELHVLASHFRRCINVELDGLGAMYLALWDPAILGTLVGQPDDDTLHVPGPALLAEQISDLLAPLSNWWYFDRSGRLHDVVSSQARPSQANPSSRQIVLGADQVDKLVEASVPDHLLQHIRQNQPELLERLPAAEHYRFARQQLHRAREHGLEGTGDLVNYICLALAFGSTFDESPSMARLLAQVREGLMTFDNALDKAPEDELAATARAPAPL